MPKIIEINEEITPTRSLKVLVEQLGKFSYQELSLHTKCRKITKLRLVSVRDIDHLKKIETMQMEGWIPPSLWEMVRAKPHIEKKISTDHWFEAVVISGNPFHSKNPETDEVIGVLFPDLQTGQFVLETLPKDAIRITGRELLFALVQYAD